MNAGSFHFRVTLLIQPGTGNRMSGPHSAMCGTHTAMHAGYSFQCGPIFLIQPVIGG